MERRKIVKVGERRYQLLKPRVDKNGWHEYGEEKSIKAINDLLLKNSTGKYELHMSDEIMSDIATYRQEQKRGHERYLSAKILENRAKSKTI